MYLYVPDTCIGKYFNGSVANIVDPHYPLKVAFGVNL